MTEQEKRKGGGAKLSRTETVTVRLDPKLRYIAELAARRQRRTLSSFIEWAIVQAVSDLPLSADGAAPLTLKEALPRLWALHPADRLIRLAEQFPELMSYEEEVIWNTIKTFKAEEPVEVQNGDTFVHVVAFFVDGELNPDLVMKCWEPLTAFGAGELNDVGLKQAMLLADPPY